VSKVIRLGGSSDVISIFDSNGTRLETILIGMAAYLDNAADNKLFNFSEPQGNRPATLQSRFYPGDNFGVEFHAAKELTKPGKFPGPTGSLKTQEVRTLLRQSVTKAWRRQQV
jgi:hypothetical protein